MIYPDPLMRLSYRFTWSKLLLLTSDLLGEFGYLRTEIVFQFIKNNWMFEPYETIQSLDFIKATKS
jgi:hypothetical protein